MKQSINLIFLIAMTFSVKAQNQTQMTINQEAAVVQKKEITINATPKEVWQVLTNIQSWDEWNKRIKKPKLSTSLKRYFCERIHYHENLPKSSMFFFHFLKYQWELSGRRFLCQAGPRCRLHYIPIFHLFQLLKRTISGGRNMKKGLMILQMNHHFLDTMF